MNTEKTLTDEEITILDKQDPNPKKNGGFQSLFISLQKSLNRKTKKITLSPVQLERIQRYAFDYDNGGWEDQLKKNFSRTLGSTLGR